ncbi:MAG: hypothetical protein M1415_07765 [Firmicutes bacterium]|nr:hypothetical protein [Bacillota bacterium]
MANQKTAKRSLGPMSGAVLGIIVGEQVGKATSHLLIGLALGFIADVVVGTSVSMMVRR